MDKWLHRNTQHRREAAGQDGPSRVRCCGLFWAVVIGVSMWWLEMGHLWGSQMCWLEACSFWPCRGWDGSLVGNSPGCE